MQYGKTRRVPVERRLCALLLCVVVAATTGVAAELTTPTIRHRPIQYFVPGHRVEVLAQVSDESGVETVRCYFRQKGAVDYSYVDMVPVGGDQYRGVLPAPESGTNEFEYLFLTVTGARCVFRTEAFAAGARDEPETPLWQAVPEDEPLTVNTDLAATLEGVPGFEDTVELASAPPEERYGITGELYGTPQDEAAGGPGLGPADVIFCGLVPVTILSGVAASGTGSGGGASGASAGTSAGTSTAAAGTTAAAGATAGAAAGVGVGTIAAGAAIVGGAVAGGVAAAGGGGGGGDGPAPSSPFCAVEPGSVNFLGQAVSASTFGTFPLLVTRIETLNIPSGQEVIQVQVNFSFDSGGTDSTEPDFGLDTFSLIYEGSTIFSQRTASSGTTVVTAESFSGNPFVDVVYEHDHAEGEDSTGFQWSATVSFTCGEIQEPLPQ